MGDSCLIEFICEHYLTFSKSLLRIILCLLSQRKGYREILKTKEFYRGKGELENGKRSEHESIFTFRMAFFRVLSDWIFTTSRAEHYSAYKIKVLHILESFGFYNEYEKVFIIFWTLQTNFCDSAHVESLLGPCSKKVSAVEPDELVF